MSNKSNPDPRQSSSLRKMDRSPTTIVPNDAGKMNVIPSKRGLQKAGNDLGQASLHVATDSPIGGGTFDDDKVVTGTGDSIPSGAFTKPANKGGGK